jgi:hypothetical protein
MAADDFQNPAPDQGFPDFDATAPYSGNRPASGARRVTPGEVLSQGFHGAENAGDFLGLDTEFTGSQGLGTAFGANPLDLVAPPTTQADYAAPYVPAPVPLPAGDPVQEFAQAPSAFEFGEDLGSEEGETSFPSESGSSRKPLLAAAVLLGGLGMGAMLYGPSLYARFFGAATEVATTPVAPGAKPKAPRAETPTQTEPGTDGASSRDPEPAPLVVGPVAGPGEDPPFRISEAARPVTNSKQEPDSPRVPRTTPSVDVDPPSDPVVVAPPSPGSGSTARPQSFPDLAGVAYQWATEDQLELIWRGSEVPLEAVHAPAKTLMPRVGNVRVFTTSGDVFEGRLYAVGQERVWIDARPGRIGIDGERVERIEVLPPQSSGQASTAEPQVGGKRVRVRVAGGMLYGRVLKTEGEDVTLALDDGGRVRVKAGDVQELGPGRAIVVRR